MSVDLSPLGMWEEWQKTVEANLSQFARSPFYVEQDSVPVERFEALAERLDQTGCPDPEGRERDIPFGARVVPTKALGDVTRMWLESWEEINFLKRHGIVFPGLGVLDIGAGYGRLAVPLSKLGANVACVDAVPVSTRICLEYTQKFGRNVMVMPLQAFEKTYHLQDYDLAINIHSFNECSMDQITAWLDILGEMRVPHLFTVSHGQLDHTPEPSYRAWVANECGPSWRPLLESRYDLMAEESLGLSPNPHALWKLR